MSSATGMPWLPLMRFTGRLPLPVLYLLAPLLYLAVYRLFHYRRAEVTQNLARVYPGLPDADRAALARRFYRQLADRLLEMLATRSLPARAFKQRISVDNPELLHQLSDGFQSPVFLLTIHQGNWEWMLHGVGQALGQPLTPVYKPLHSEAADRFMREARGRLGAEPVAVGDLSNQLLRRRREPRLWVMLADQSPVSGERSQTVDFLGQRTRFHAAPVALAGRLAAPVVFARCHRLRRGHYRVSFETLAENAATVDEHELVQRYADAAASAIGEEPESWLWSNRRWKRDVEPADA